MHNRALIITILAVIAAVAIFLSPHSKNTFQASGQTTLRQATLSVGDKTFKVELAESDEQKADGLSNRPNLAPETGMLFIFNPPMKPSFWMKDMRFPLDFVWIKNSQVVEITRGVPPPKSGTKVDDLPNYTPNQEVDYVLEINIGESTTINVGDKVIISNLQTT